MSLLKAGRPSTKKERAISAVQNVGKGTIRMNINVPKDFYKKIKQVALDKDITVTDLVVKAVDEYISK